MVFTCGKIQCLVSMRDTKLNEHSRGENQTMECANRRDSDMTVHARILIIVFTVRITIRVNTE